MKRHLYSLLFLAAIVGACNPKSGHDEHQGHDMGAMEGDSTNTILYNQVMDIHDEVMPKMEDLYNLKKDLEARLATASATEKAALEARIAHIDSASNLMMEWMHGFNPPADTADQEQSRAYLEAEMEKVKAVREAIVATLGETRQ